MKLPSFFSGPGRTLLSAAVLFLAESVTHAAIVTWGSATNISGDSDVKTDGTLTAAINIGAASTTVNGVLFGGLMLSGNSVTSGNFTISDTTFLAGGAFFAGAGALFINLSPAYRTLLGAGGGDNGPSPFTLTMNALTIGQTYEFQWWSNNSSGGAHIITTATAGNSVSLDANAAGVANGLGQFAVGTFVADATSEAINYSIPTGGDILSGFQLRQVIPEPGTALFGLALTGVCGLTRRRARR